ncbi:MAG: hypothetical protein KAH26_07930 [Bacteroidales bacterium]|nr:hypothetical protein [Bacteroidales bacterium]
MIRWFIFILFVAILSMTGNAQYGSFGVTDARSLGMGNTYNATTYDLYAIGKNPGLLAKKGGEFKVSFIFPNTTAQQYGVGDALSTFDYYSTNKLKSDGLISLDKEKFQVAIDNNGIMFVDMLLGFLSASYHPNERIGSFAFSMSDYMTGYMDIPDIILDVNYGTEIPDGSFSLDKFAFKAWWIRTYAISYSRYLYKDQSIYRNKPGLIRNISGGITTKYVMTYAYTDIGLSANVNYSTATQTLSGDYQAHAIYAFSEDLDVANSFNQGHADPPPGFMKLKPAGRGFGIDIGAGAELRKGWILGLAVTDIGSINWTGSARSSDFNGYIDISGVIDYETIDSLSHGINLVRESKEDFRTPMPTTLRLGVALRFEEMFKRFPGELLVGFDYNQGLNNQPSNFTAPRFSMGFQYRYKPKWPILLGGYTYDLLDVGRGAVGLGYDTWFVDVYVSTIDIFSIVSGGPRFSASLVARWKLFSGHQKNKGPDCL